MLGQRNIFSKCVILVGGVCELLVRSKRSRQILQEMGDEGDEIFKGIIDGYGQPRNKHG